ncbi:tRNA (adenosine(37)-N6)-threonylcarbamoyltransferase complex dimerization subunit type 1 TsaB [Staphylospora marina]|uniref:tRNA (adenosine(37)-N6)-threonylcarbamoyltransferase complex dimerization subunit type 1 TsaB n=1 Tax=Staphylospora marina TaxID=2490858 RepID=UPI000F5C0D1D|nr:tRNA (adenosine(37)-N6)-threonylcarbamoyltransferase complex dimerization subunit type 1 TsaB [Staphylospora marina]
MKLLAMDTTTLVMGVAVLDLEDHRLLGEITTNLHKNHSVRLMPTVDGLLRELGLSMDDIGVLAVTSGPGSYTGIRIGVTTAKTISWARNLPLYSESSLTVLAMNAGRFPGAVVPLFDARRRRVYTGVYRTEGQRVTEVMARQVMPVDVLLEKLDALEEPVLFLGDDAGRFEEDIRARLGERALFGNPADNVPRAGQLACLCAERHRRGERPETMDFSPDYLQLTEAELNWLKRESGEQCRG